MALIRHAQAEQIARDAIVLDLGDVRAQAELMIQQARAHAEAIVREARAERERLIAGAAEQGHAAGFAEGHAKGEAQGRIDGQQAALKDQAEALAHLQDAWNAALAEFEARRQDLICDAQESLLRLACAIASRVTHRTIEFDPSVVADQVRHAIAMVIDPSRLRVAVAPEDEALAREALPGVLASLGSSAHAEVCAEPGLARGSCIVKCAGDAGASGAGAGGVIDASIQTQLDRLTQALVPGADLRAADQSVAPPRDDAP